jgi:hypothetical protein
VRPLSKTLSCWVGDGAKGVWPQIFKEQVDRVNKFFVHTGPEKSAVELFPLRKKVVQDGLICTLVFQFWFLISSLLSISFLTS